MKHPHEATIKRIMVDMRAAGKSWTKVAVALNAADTRSITGMQWEGRICRSFSVHKGWTKQVAPKKRLRGSLVHTNPIHSVRLADGSRKPNRVTECAGCGHRRSISARDMCRQCCANEVKRISKTSHHAIKRLVAHHGARSAARCLGVDVDEVIAWIRGAEMPEDSVVRARVAADRFDADKDTRNPWVSVPIFDELDRMIPVKLVG